MAVIELSRLFAFSAFLTTGRANKKGQNVLRSALPYCRLSGARVARQRCPVLQPSHHSLAHLRPFKLGHLYFADLRTFLLCIDSMAGALTFGQKNRTLMRLRRAPSCRG